MSLRTSRASAALDSYRTAREREAAIFRAQRTQQVWVAATVLVAVLCAVAFIVVTLVEAGGA